MDLADIIGLIGPKKLRKTANGYLAVCPAHDDNSPSLSISAGDDGRVLLKCFAGCSVESICANLGIKVSDLFADKTPEPKKEIVAIYPYYDENRNLLFETVRYSPKDFRQRRIDPKTGRRVWNLEGVRRVIYRLPEIKQAVYRGETIIICEGEKDVDALVAQGFQATCNPMGAGKWSGYFNKTFKDANVVVIPDNDKPGQDHALSIARNLDRVAKSIKIIELPGVKDATDYFQAGGTADGLKALIARTDVFTLGTPLTPSVSGLRPAEWFAAKFPGMEKTYGVASYDLTDKGFTTVRDVNEDFIAASLGPEGSPDQPTVFINDEARFYRYNPRSGIFEYLPEPAVLKLYSALFLEWSRACKSASVITEDLEFRFRSSSRLSGILRKAKAELAVDADYFNSHLREFIPCANGMLDLSDMTLKPFSASFRRRNKLSVGYDPQAHCPMFLDTLMRPALDPDDLDLLQRCCGLYLIGENASQKLMLLLGTAGGGKGTFIRILIGIIGQDNVATLRPSLLSERFEASRFLGRTLLYGSDVSEDFLNHNGAQVIKSLVGGDFMTVELKGSNERPSFTSRFNIICCSNSRLRVRLESDADAWRRRLAIIQYTKAKPEHPIADLSERILRQEGSGVLNWMLQGLMKLRADNWELRLTTKQQGLVDNLLRESDSVDLFVRECLVRKSGAKVAVTDCFEYYIEFCNKRDWVAISRKRFGDACNESIIRHHGLTIRHDIKDQFGKNQRGWSNLGFIAPDSPAPITPSEPSEFKFTDGEKPVHPIPANADAF